MASRDVFPAAYPGRCAACQDEFDEHDPIGFIDTEDKPVCEECWVMWS